MGNVPAKITGKYQSYDINTPNQLTPSMPQTRRVDAPTPNKSHNFINEHTESDNFYTQNKVNATNNERSIEVDELEEEIVKSEVSNENDIDEFDSKIF